ncbi:sugar transferase [Novipirellula sp.]|uniref:sugar transferase n=1 Tax=Novipirellula sp. TaxID=2795430 RepID=UPI003569200A
MLKLISRYATNYTTRRRINTWILTGREFDREIARERARTVRRNIPFCVLQIELCAAHRTAKNTRSLAKLVRRNVRMSDEKGHVNRFTIGVLLVDTPEMGGRIVMDRLNGLLSSAHLKAEISLSVYDPQAFNNDDSDDSSANGGDQESGGTKVRLHDKHPVGRDRRRFHDDELIGSGTRMATPHSSEAFDLMSTRVSNVSFQVDSVVKRTFDVAVASAGLLFAAPVIAFAAALIKRDGGPAFFLQSREGRDGVPFTIYKLRTMVVNAESQQAELRDKSERDGPAFKMRNDPRVTRFGQMLRSTCVDELPQLWNVLRGDMSIVGPRPLPVSESRACQPWHRRRLDVRPGITCNWQVAKEKADTFDEWMRMDLAYVDNANLWKDVTLMAQTVGVPLRAKGSR